VQSRAADGMGLSPGGFETVAEAPVHPSSLFTLTLGAMMLAGSRTPPPTPALPLSGR